MSDAVSPSRAAPGRKIAIGLLRLTDSAPAIVAHAFGFFADEGLDVALSVEPSWANVADKLAFGALDAAVIVPPLAFAVSLGLRGPAEPLIIPYNVSLGGDMITLAKDLAAQLRDDARGVGYAAALAARLKASEGEQTLAVVHDYSTHNLILRYWLAAAGALAERDYAVIVTPPARMVEALGSGRIAGFCAGAPWGDIAERAGVGATVATSGDVWRNGPGKALAVRERWAEQRPEALSGLLRALYRGARFCDAPANATYVAALLSRRAWLAVDSHAILSSLPGTHGRNETLFHGSAATYPWRSHALWFLTQMTRWGLVEPGLPLRPIAERVYRPDLYAAALAPVGAPIPASDRKREGEHAADWSLPASPAPIPMGPDIFCDGAVFDPETIV
ncbi:NitT/TauT family transport system ATP-binding protein/nitrate/nitrite transport system substrate-binding protein [Roseiarcus fermentans]|uniref:NitT/TauT family transport system ATP-binding protein/nitrate/nitrite transport system substrate-binding protein n=1 Tax=Roseiarcus fermentans TaxID=1473586 RepID=A0A366EEV7_9HYPH|nr:CmpA/NrtA family ABC transporter substrate-binding protein [Roseiarcus fermentans]RBP00951.1 NitT/TauT family transport system ATP-binding protein/nitrate/nitrite transport system substrate-binding protein [Roseiarcus fermentans]